MNQAQCPQKGRNTRLGLDVVLFFALYIISPAYLAVEFHRSLPLITLSRGLLVLMGLMTLLRRRSLFRLSGPDWRGMNFGLTDQPLLRWGLVAYFVLLLITDAALFPGDKAESLKAIFVVVLEEYVLVWLLSLAIDTRKKLTAALAALSVAAGVTGALAVLSVILEQNPFHLLDTVSREMLMTEYYRLGALRAEAGFGHPVFYGAFCVIMLPILLYFGEFAPKRWQRIVFIACQSCNLAGLLLSNSRGSSLVLVVLLLIIAVTHFMRRRLKIFLRVFLPALLGAVVIVAIALATMPQGEYFLAMTFYSTWKELFPNSSLAMPTQPTNPSATVPEFGDNPAGVRSRLVQLTGVLRTLRERPIFGYGSNANTRGLIYYQFNGIDWWPGESFDMGIVSVVCQYGLVGLLGYGAMYVSVFFTTAKEKYRNDELMYALGMAFVAYMGCMVVISSLAKVLWVVIGSIVCLVNIIDRERASR